MPRVLLVSNRLPVTLVRAESGLVAQRSSGGLATALASVHEHGGSMWFGWPGPVEAPLPELEALLDPLRAVPVPLTADEVRKYYDGFSNGVLWPLCHYLLDKVELDAHENWAAYESVNERFADQVARHWRPGDLVWVHDYQLMLLPALVRERCPGARIGFFLHVPFPGPEVFRILPWREELLRGLLGADVIGFHTASYAYHFTYACSQLLGLELAGDVLQVDGRPVRVGAFPIGIDALAFEERAKQPQVRARAEEIRAEAQGRTIVLSVDRLDYTKGLPRRLLSLERLLLRRPELRERLHVIQLAVPTRENVDAYADYRRAVNELVGRINGAFGTPTRNVVHLMHRSVPPEELSALYAAADVMMVTPLRDGMNLVAKEYVASRVDDTGVLILSEFAGAATELHEAMQVNPFDLVAVGEVLARAVELPAEEQRTRMAALRQTVRAGSVRVWAQSLVDALAEVAVGPTPPPPDEFEQALGRLLTAPRLLLALDYDGTLVDFTTSPSAAAPDAALKALLAQLCARPGTHVHVISGRSRESLEAFLGALPLGLHAEHGLFSRRSAGEPWRARSEVPPPWMEVVRPLIKAAVRRTDGAMLEEKSGSLAFHYRATEPQLSARRAAELKQQLLAHPLAGSFDVLEGNRVLEVRQRGVNKGVVVPALLEGEQEAAVLAIGDDRTDEDLFMALPPGAVSIHVGSGQSAARFHVPDVAAVRALLRRFVEARR
jgi:trehalose 6-phosphate synthase/phosphatase